MKYDLKRSIRNRNGNKRSYGCWYLFIVRQLIVPYAHTTSILLNEREREVWFDVYYTGLSIHKITWSFNFNVKIKRRGVRVFIISGLKHWGQVKLSGKSRGLVVIVLVIAVIKARMNLIYYRR